MNTLTNEQKARIFNCHSGSYIILHKGLPNQQPIQLLSAYISGRKETKGEILVLLKNEDGHVYELWAPNIVLIKTPLSAIADEDAIQVATLLKGKRDWVVERHREDIYYLDVHETKVTHGHKIRWNVNVYWLGKDIHVALFENDETTGQQICADTNLAWQFLRQRGYAVPEWIDIDHPDNGKDAIQLGLAIDKTTLK